MEALMPRTISSFTPAAEAIARSAETPETSREALHEAARFMASTETADAVTQALNAYGGTLQSLYDAGGPAPAAVSRIANGRSGPQGVTVSTLALIALAMNKTLKIVIE
jgi:hypothetical protein